MYAEAGSVGYDLNSLLLDPCMQASCEGTSGIEEGRPSLAASVSGAYNANWLCRCLMLLAADAGHYLPMLAKEIIKVGLCLASAC
jgi:hypothetical protein